MSVSCHPRPLPSFPRKRESTPRPIATPGYAGVLDSVRRRNDGGGAGNDDGDGMTEGAQAAKPSPSGRGWGEGETNCTRQRRIEQRTDAGIAACPGPYSLIPSYRYPTKTGMTVGGWYGVGSGGVSPSPNPLPLGEGFGCVAGGFQNDAASVIPAQAGIQNPGISWRSNRQGVDSRFRGNDGVGREWRWGGGLVVESGSPSPNPLPLGEGLRRSRPYS